jgi:two-component system, sensor histidine kinase
MNPKLPFFNWSLKKLLYTEADAFNKARIRILFIILLLSLVKALIVLFTYYNDQQSFQFTRAWIAVAFYIIMIKLMLYKRVYLNTLIHVMITAGIVIVWTNIFITVQAINIITLQFAFMVVLSGFYLLNRSWGMVYAILSVLPIIFFLTLSNTGMIHFDYPPQELAYPASLYIIILNFVTIIFGHYMYHQAFSSNMAEKQSLNIQLAESVKEANKYAQSKSDFLSTMSHELRTPLNMVIGMTDLLLDSPHDKEQEENLRIMNFSATSLHTLINDILDFNKLDSGKLGLEAIHINLYDLMNTICAGLELQAKEKGLQLHLEIDEKIKDQPVVTDPTRITQIIYNLVGNGIKFTGKGNVSLALKVTGQTSDTIQILFSVKDTGIGINKDKYETIFEPFTQASTNTTRNYGGTGLGLSIVRKLLALFHSEIRLESTPGKGSHFFFEIDFQTGHMPVTTTANNESQSDLKGLRLLAAEDNPMNTFLLKRLCTKWNVELSVVTNGKEAVDAVSTHHYDILLMDIHMPEMDGYTATKAIRNMAETSKANIPIIALTASVSNELELDIKQAGMNDYLRKPFNMKELYRKLKEHFVMKEVGSKK